MSAYERMSKMSNLSITDAVPLKTFSLYIIPSGMGCEARVGKHATM